MADYKSRRSFSKFEDGARNSIREMWGLWHSWWHQNLTSYKSWTSGFWNLDREAIFCVSRWTHWMWPILIWRDGYTDTLKQNIMIIELMFSWIIKSELRCASSSLEVRDFFDARSSDVEYDLMNVCAAANPVSLTRTDEEISWVIQSIVIIVRLLLLDMWFPMIMKLTQFFNAEDYQITYHLSWTFTWLS